MQSIEALRAGRYAGELRAHGITFVTSPRHADIVLVTGALSALAREPLLRVLAAVPEPYALVAVGNCAIDGCVFSGGEAVTDRPADVLGAHVEIAGCPPSPAQILAAITRAQAILATSDDDTAGGEEDEDEDGADRASLEELEGES